eukprot:13140995-Alexandrium_andersonii.AAC.1
MPGDRGRDRGGQRAQEAAPPLEGALAGHDHPLDRVDAEHLAHGGGVRVLDVCRILDHDVH